MDYLQRRIAKFFEKAQSKHGERYSYEKSIYRGIKEKIIITCSVHGDFETTADSHVNLGTGCPNCAGNVMRNTPWFLEEAEKIHGSKYDYSKTKYTGMLNKVEIICPRHESFHQEARSHLKGRGCAQCSVKAKVSYETFVKRSMEIHGNRYEYVENTFSKMLSKTTIVCVRHGPFQQTPALHISQAQGCPTCAIRYGGKESRWLDSLGVVERQVTIRLDGFPKTQRVDGYRRDSNTVYEFHGNIWHGNPRIYHPDDVSPITGTTFGELYDRSTRRDTAIENAGYNLVVMWEDEFDALERKV